MMRKVIIALLAVLSFAALRTIKSAAYSVSSDSVSDTLYQLPFSKYSEFNIVEGPDSLVIIINEGDSVLPGRVIAYNPVKKTFSELMVFSGNKGTLPLLGVVSHNRKDLVYGTTAFGGKNNCGLIYSLNIQTREQKILAEFGTIAPDFHPLKGLVKIHPDLIVGLCTVNDTTNFYEYDIITGHVYIHRPVLSAGEHLEKFLPVPFDDDKIAFIASKSSEDGMDDIVSIVEYDLTKRKVISSVQCDFAFRPASDPVVAKNGCVYVSHWFGGSIFRPAPAIDYCFVRYDPKNNSIMRIQTPPDETTVWGTPLNTDKKGNLIGAFLYGGKDNGGYVFRFDVEKNALNIVKEWKDFEPGPMTSKTKLLHHSNGLFFGFSFAGGEDMEGCFFSLNPETKAAVKLAEFKPE